MSMLDRKVLRDLWTLRTQALAIVLLIASGVAMFEMALSNYLTLRSMQAHHYEREAFADVFAEVKRAPASLAARISEIDGVAVAEARIVQPVRIVREDGDVSISGRVISIPSVGQPELNRLRLIQGRWIDPGKRNEVLVNVAFAEARHVRPGDSIVIILNGRLEKFTIAGVALSPEYVFATRSGLPLPDDHAYAILWAERSSISAAFNMEGAFNNIAVRLAPGASEAAVIAEIDRSLEPYGGTSAIGRRDHPSHRFVEDELAEQRTMSLVMPLIFLGIASFLLNVVIGRLVSAQREQIASLKALGYPNAPILFHYLKLSGALVLAGTIVGSAAGAWLGVQMIEMYRPFFRFPDWSFEFRPWLPLVAGALAFASAMIAVVFSVAAVVRLPAAVALRPAMPSAASTAQLRSLRRLGLSGPRTLLFVRTMIGRPLRTLMTICGLMLAVPLVTMGLFWWDSLGYMIDFNFERVERGDAQVTLFQPLPTRSVREILRIPGVIAVEGSRLVSVRLINGHRSYRTVLQGLSERSELRVPRESDYRPVEIPPDGVVLSRRLATRLSVSVGDMLTIEIQEGARQLRQVAIAGLADDILGLSAYIARPAVNRLMREGDLVNSVALRIDPRAAPDVWSKLQQIAKVEAVAIRASLLRTFDEKISGLINISAMILTSFGVLIAFGVVYNAARVAYQERAWELATLRILGFTRREIAFVLFGELVVVVAIALPLGLILAHQLIGLILRLRDNESFQLPAIISPATFAISALVIVVASVASTILVRRMVDRLDLVAVLKTRD